MNNAPNGEAIEDVTLRTAIRLQNDMENKHKLAEKLTCVKFRVFNAQMMSPEEQIEAAASEKQQQQKALVEIKMRKLNLFINKPFANGFCVLEYSKLKIYGIVIHYNDSWPSNITTILQFSELFPNIFKTFWTA